MTIIFPKIQIPLLRLIPKNNLEGQHSPERYYLQVDGFRRLWNPYVAVFYPRNWIPWLSALVSLLLVWWLNFREQDSNHHFACLFLSYQSLIKSRSTLTHCPVICTPINNNNWLLILLHLIHKRSWYIIEVIRILWSLAGAWCWFHYIFTLLIKCNQLLN